MDTQGSRNTTEGHFLCSYPCRPQIRCACLRTDPTGHAVDLPELPHILTRTETTHAGLSCLLLGPWCRRTMGCTVHAQLEKKYTTLYSPGHLSFCGAVPAVHESLAQ